MIYTFGCSITKWYWPTWSDWIQLYEGPVTNFGYTGYSNENIYWNVLNNLDNIKKDDRVIIMWTQGHRLNLWYDKDWIDNADVLGFFPETNGRLWYSGQEPYRGMYRTHPEYQPSLTHMIIDQFRTMYNTQLLLNQIGCDYTMMIVHNPFLDTRPVYKPKFELTWHKKGIITDSEKEFARGIVKLEPIKNIIKLIDWTKFVEPVIDPLNESGYVGMWEYYFNKKEYLIYSHDTDPHPSPLVHHDYAVEKILKQNPKKSKYRKLAIDFSKKAMSMYVPPMTPDVYVAPPETEMLDTYFVKILNEL